MTELRFAVMGTGMIARGVAPRIEEGAGCTVTFVASRDAGRARAFAEQHPHAHAGTYDEVLTRPDVDAVYLATTTDLHPEWCLRLLEANKHVLCEKPLAWTRADAARLFAAAETRGLVLAEAFMSLQSRSLLEAARIARDPRGPIGRLHRVEARFEVPLAAGPGTDNTRFSRRLGGGALLDLGGYCLLFGRLVTGEEPAIVEARAERADWFHASTGDDAVDRAMYARGRFPSGVELELSCDLGGTGLRVLGRAVGDRGVIDLPHFLVAPGYHQKEIGAPEPETPAEWPDARHLYRAQAESFAARVRGRPYATPVPDPAWSIAQAAAVQRVLELAGEGRAAVL